MAKEITPKSTKNEVLEAYNELLTKVKEQKSTDRKAEKTKEHETKIVETATQNSPEKIMKALGEMKLECVRMLDGLGERLLAEHRKLTEMQQAIETESNHLNEIHEIKVDADSLAALLLAQKEKKLAFDAEMETKRQTFEEEMSLKKIQWKQEQENYELLKKERDAQIKKDRQREEEEYGYATQLKRKKEADQYEAEKAKRDKELSAREEAVAARESEFAALQAKVDSFPAELKKAIQDAEKTVRENIELQFKHKSELGAKDVEGEKKLTQQIITSLEKKIKEQEDLIRQLTQKATDAVAQVQTVALKTIEGAAAQRIAAASREKEMDKS